MRDVIFRVFGSLRVAFKLGLHRLALGVEVTQEAHIPVYMSSEVEFALNAQLGLLLIVIERLLANADDIGCIV